MSFHHSSSVMLPPAWPHRRPKSALQDRLNKKTVLQSSGFFVIPAFLLLALSVTIPAISKSVSHYPSCFDTGQSLSQLFQCRSTTIPAILSTVKHYPSYFDRSVTIPVILTPVNHYLSYFDTGQVLSKLF